MNQIIVTIKGKEEVIKKLKLRLKPINRTNRLVRAEDADDAADNKKDH